ncbi:MAG: hypothetical protein Q9159_003568 [Coniocarpon cinnabarinum]
MSTPETQQNLVRPPSPPNYIPNLYGYTVDGAMPKPEGVLALEFPNLSRLFQRQWNLYGGAPRSDTFAGILLWKYTLKVCGDGGANFKVDQDALPKASLTIYDICSNGAQTSQIIDYSEVFRDIETPGTMRTFAGSCVMNLREAPADLAFRVVLADITGVAAVDLYTLEALCGAFDLDAESLWYLTREAQEGPDEAQGLFPSPFPQFMEDVHTVWRKPHSINIGSITSPIAGALDEGGYYPSLLRDSIILKSTQLTCCAAARQVLLTTTDLRKGFVVGTVYETYCQTQTATPFLASLKAILHYHLLESRAVLAEHQCPRGIPMRDDKDVPVGRIPSLSWQILRKSMQHLEQQYLMLSKLRGQNRLPKIQSTELDVELNDFDNLIQDMRCLLSARRELLDHELNETLLRESRANLKIAQQTIKESQQNGLLTFLAFIFVPFSLSTSVFGMNLQELNNNGRSIGAFIATGLILFVAFIFLYAFATAFNIARNNFKERSRLLYRDIRKTEANSQGSGFRRLQHTKLQWNFGRWKAMIRRGLLLAIVSRGRFDPKGYQHYHELWNTLEGQEEKQVKQPIPERHRKELKYFLGLHRLPYDEDYDSLWKQQQQYPSHPPQGPPASMNSGYYNAPAGYGQYPPPAGQYPPPPAGQYPPPAAIFAPLIWWSSRKSVQRQEPAQVNTFEGGPPYGGQPPADYPAAPQGAFAHNQQAYPQSQSPLPPQQSPYPPHQGNSPFPPQQSQYPPPQGTSPFPPHQAPFPSPQPPPGQHAGYSQQAPAPGATAQALRSAMRGIGTNEAKLIQALASMPNDPYVQEVHRAYHHEFKRHLVRDLESETSGDFRSAVVAVARGPVAQDAHLLYHALHRTGTTESVLDDTLLAKSTGTINSLKETYQRLYHRSLESDLKGDLSFGTEDLFMIVLYARRAEEYEPVDPNMVFGDVTTLRGVLEGKERNEKLFATFAERSDGQLRAVSQAYQSQTGRTLRKAVERKYSGHMENALLRILACAEDRAKADADALEDPMKGPGTREAKLTNRLVRIHWDPQHLDQVKKAYRHYYRRDLKERIRGETSGDYRDMLMALCGPDVPH